MTTTYERIRELNQSTSTDPNMLKDLHDCIYQWAETIPTGGAKQDISTDLKRIYQTHSERISQKNQAALATAEKHQAESLEVAVDSNSANAEQIDSHSESDFDLKDAGYDPEHILSFDSDEEEDTYYDDYH